MVYKYDKLRGRIIEKYGSQANLADELGLSEQSVTKKMRGQVGFSQTDIIKWCKLLDIDTNQISEYFFA